MRRGHAGFTLLEVLIATLLMVVGLVGSIALTLGMMRVNKTNNGRDTAYFVAQQALDELGLVPLSEAGIGTTIFPPNSAPSANNGDPPLGMVGTGTPLSTSLTCYPMGNDAIADRPIGCAAADMPASYFVRTWVCCAPAGTPLPTGAGGCAANLTLYPAGTLQSPDTQNSGAVCLLQAEVTWPTENPTVLAGAIYSAIPAGLFVPDGTPTLPYANHILLTEVREQ